MCSCSIDANELGALSKYARMQLCGEQTLRKDSIIAELAACKTLASKQASEDVVGGANTPSDGATRGLSARRGASIMDTVYCGHLPGSARVSPLADISADAVVIAAARRQALLKNRGRTWPPTPSTPPQAASGQEANRPPDAPSIDNSQQRRHRHADALGS